MFPLCNSKINGKKRTLKKHSSTVQYKCNQRLNKITINECSQCSRKIENIYSVYFKIKVLPWIRNEN